MDTKVKIDTESDEILLLVPRKLTITVDITDDEYAQIEETCALSRAHGRRIPSIEVLFRCPGKSVLFSVREQNEAIGQSEPTPPS